MASERDYDPENDGGIAIIVWACAAVGALVIFATSSSDWGEVGIVVGLGVVGLVIHAQARFRRRARGLDRSAENDDGRAR